MDELSQIQLEVKALRKQLSDVQIENENLKRIINENDIDLDAQVITNEEAICVNEIKKLKDLSDSGMFGKEEATILDILYKNLRMIRGQNTDQGSKKKLNKKIDTKELFKIVEGK